MIRGPKSPAEVSPAVAAHGHPPGISLEPTKVRRLPTGQSAPRRLVVTTDRKHDAMGVRKGVLEQILDSNFSLFKRNTGPAIPADDRSLLLFFSIRSFGNTGAFPGTVRFAVGFSKHLK